ncbi:MAG TPA: hypothetical protein VL098_04870 [Flavipsychrobacter sp.]|nr:hypothetical protein [Flavipsychrobacter sp.]
MNFTDITPIGEFSYSHPGERRDQRIDRAGKLTGIELRLLPPYIKNNRTLRLYPFFPGRARLYCCAIVISDVENELKSMVDLQSFHEVGDKDFLPINRSVFYWTKDTQTECIPEQVHVMCAVIKSKERVRDIGDTLTCLFADRNYQTLQNRLSELVPQTVTGKLLTNASLEVVDILGQYLGHVDDRPLGMMVKSFTRLHGDWDQAGIRSLYINTQDVDFNAELIIRH